jgi:hypothetical protein
MTNTKDDWAMEVASRIVDILDVKKFGIGVLDVVEIFIILKNEAELRGRIKGLREAAKLMDDMPTLAQFLSCYDGIRELADKLEKGET